jgi:hypothetical protein
MTLKEVIELINQERIKEAYRISERLLNNGMPITSIRRAIYDPFQYYLRTNPKMAKEIIKVFGEDYKFKYWLKEV